jgi:hypothetical protein
MGGSVLLFACGFLHTQPEPAFCMEGWEHERWIHTIDADTTVDVTHYRADNMLQWPLRYRGQSAKHDRMFVSQDHGIGLTGCEGSIYTIQQVYDIL